MNECLCLLLQIDPSRTYDRLAKIYYDANRERIAIHEEFSEGQQREFYDEIALYREVRNTQLLMKNRATVCL